MCNPGQRCLCSTRVLTLMMDMTTGGAFAATLQRPLIQRGVRAVAGIVIMVFGVLGVLG
jgi:hypothetical protein